MVAKKRSKKPAKKALRKRGKGEQILTVRAKKLREVLRRALSDAKFAESLKDKGLAAGLAGLGSHEWREYMRLFAANEDELERFTTPGKKVDGVAAGATITTLVGGACTGATTGALLRLVPAYTKG